jgi:hypothetical protein
MKEIILSVVFFHWLATLCIGAALVADALSRPLRRATSWAFPAQVVRAISQSVYERQDEQSEPSYSRAA